MVSERAAVGGRGRGSAGCDLPVTMMETVADGLSQGMRHERSQLSDTNLVLGRGMLGGGPFRCTRTIVRKGPARSGTDRTVEDTRVEEKSQDSRTRRRYQIATIVRVDREGRGKGQGRK